MNRKTVSVIIYSIFIVTVLTQFLGFKNAWAIFNMTHYPVLILVEIICAMMGVSTRRGVAVCFQG